MTAQQEIVQSLKDLYARQVRTYIELERAIEALTRCVVFAEDDVHARLDAVTDAMTEHRVALGYAKSLDKKMKEQQCHHEYASPLPRASK